MTNDDRLASDAWEALFRAQSRLMRTFASERIWDRISIREYDVLYSCRSCDRPELTLTELADRVLIPQPSLSRLVDSLVQRGLLCRRINPDDRRSTLIRLTDDGLEAQRTVGRKHAASIAEHMQAALDDTELHELQRLCEKLTAAQRRLQDQRASAGVAPSPSSGTSN